MQGLKVPIIILVFLSVLGLAILTESLVHGRQVSNPLASELQELSGVAEARVEGRGTKTTVHVQLQDRIDLVAVYPEIRSRMEHYLGANTGHLNLIDARTENLTKIYYDLRFQIEEALATGHFTRMASEVAERANESGLTDHSVYIDSENVYLQLHQGEAYLYEIVPRYHQAQGVNHS